MADDPWGLRKMSLGELYAWTADMRSNTDKHLAGQQEITRRNQIPIACRSWIAIAISAVGLLVAVAALLASTQK